MNDKDNVECPKCLGTGEVFNGKFVSKCKLCDGSGEVKPEIEEAFIDEHLYDED